MLIATHEMGFARDIARRVCFLEEGRIIEDAPARRAVQPAPRTSAPGASCAGIVDAGAASDRARRAGRGGGPGVRAGMPE